MRYLKLAILSLFLIILIQSVLAENVNLGSSVYSNGKKVTLVSVSPDSVVVSIDGVKGIVSLNDVKEINGIKIEVTYIFFFDAETGSADLGVSGTSSVIEETKPICGDNKCDDSVEDSSICCKDCGCEYGFGCENNKCVKAECMKDSECYGSPKDFCSLDKCDSLTKKCIHKPITNCVINDKCCPTNCYYPDDTDCPTTKINPNPSAKKEETSNEGTTNSTEGNPQNQEKVSIFKKIINLFLSLFSKK